MTETRESTATLPPWMGANQEYAPSSAQTTVVARHMLQDSMGYADDFSDSADAAGTV